MGSNMDREKNLNSGLNKNEMGMRPEVLERSKIRCKQETGELKG